MPRGIYDRKAAAKARGKKTKAALSARALLLEASKIVSALTKVYGEAEAGAAKLLFTKLKEYYKKKSK